LCCVAWFGHVSGMTINSLPTTSHSFSLPMAAR
jgi:hypothetical protein